MKAEFSLLTSLALSYLRKTQNFRVKSSLLRTEDTNTFLKGEIHLYVEQQLEDTNTSWCMQCIPFYLEDKSYGSDGQNSIYVPKTFGSGDLQAVNKEKDEMQIWVEFRSAGLHVTSHLCKLLWATLLTLRALTEQNKLKDETV